MTKWRFPTIYMSWIGIFWFLVCDFVDDTKEFFPFQSRCRSRVLPAIAFRVL